MRMLTASSLLRRSTSSGVSATTTGTARVPSRTGDEPAAADAGVCVRGGVSEPTAGVGACAGESGADGRTRLALACALCRDAVLHISSPHTATSLTPSFSRFNRIGADGRLGCCVESIYAHEFSRNLTQSAHLRR
jgi:hypothetical protein